MIEGIMINDEVKNNVEPVASLEEKSKSSDELIAQMVDTITGLTSRLELLEGSKKNEAIVEPRIANTSTGDTNNDTARDELRKEMFIEDMDVDFKDFLVKRKIDINNAKYEALKVYKTFYNELKGTVKVEEDSKSVKKTPTPKQEDKEAFQKEQEKKRSLFYTTGRR
jgi:deoxyribodipyrimidine photolyase